MKIKLLIMVMSVFLLNTAANAAMITYNITGLPTLISPPAVNR